MARPIRTYGDPVLKTPAAPVDDVNGKVARLVDDMFETLYHSELGLALAASPKQESAESDCHCCDGAPPPAGGASGRRQSLCGDE